MKTNYIPLALLISTLGIYAQVARPNAQRAAKPVDVPAPTAYAVTKADGNSRVWERTVYEQSPTGQIVAKKRGYTELGSGLNYKNRFGQWVESKEWIEILPNGTAQAIQGQHQAYFPGNIYKGVVEVVTPDGVHQKSRPMGLSYFDGTNSVLIAELKSSAGVVVGSNVVIYPDAFTDFKADIRYTYKRGGFEQDIILQEQPPAPETFGLNPATARLEVLTEFFNTADPVRTAAKFNSRDRLQDETLAFGKMQMMPGKAFVIGDAAATNSKPVKVYKSWQHLDGRTFLVEELPVQKLAKELKKLPVPASAAPAVSPKQPGRKASTTRALPPVLVAQADTGAVHLALNDMSYKSGVVLDYVETGATGTGFVFSPGTYYISSDLGLFDYTTFYGGAVLKFKEYYGGSLNLYGPVSSYSDPSNPVIITSSDDDSVGEVISGSSGYPNVWNSMENAINAWSDGITLDSFHFNYCSLAFNNYNENSTSIFWNCEFNNCLAPSIFVATGSVVLRNVLNPSVGFSNPDEYCALDAQHVTSVNQPFLYSFYWAGANSISIKNSIIIGDDGGQWTYSYSTLEAVATDQYDFASDGVHNFYYLPANSPYHNAGVTDIDGNLLNELQSLTTYAPQDGSGLDNDQPDLGYHYAPPPTNPDLDGDGLPDAWEMQIFGNYTHAGSDIDANGHTLLYDYQNGITPDGTDFDGDGLPDWWEWKYFGTFSQSGTNDYDGDFTINVDEYNNEADPNKIQFTIEADNDFVNHTNVSMQLAITTGVPNYYAVLLNGSTTTNWQTFTTTNLAFNLGTTDGVYAVNIGLKGLPADAQQTWHDYGFTVDRVAPVLVITNPTLSSATGLVVKPYLQIQGFANEQLTSLSYDITNAMGKLTNQDVFVTDQGFDTNESDFTTNWFQAYDVPLTNGLNKLTLRVTDRAGNITTTNFSVTLDYTTATNPVVKLTWPTNGMELCGSNFTLRGWTDDETASLGAQIVSTNGTTNIVTGSVERSGVLWVENLPLSGGTNWLTLNVTNAAGHASVTNIMVIKSDMILTLTNIVGDLWQPPVDVSGLISDPDYTVWVNGIQATNHGDGTWSAANVPVTAGGVASFDMAAVNGGDPAGNLNVVKPAEIVMVDYQETKTYKWRASSSDSDNATWHKHFNQAGQDGPYTASSDIYFYGVTSGSPYSEDELYLWSNTSSSLLMTSGGTSTYYSPIPWDGDPNGWDALATAIIDRDQIAGCAGCVGGGYEARYMTHYYADVKYHWDLAAGVTQDAAVKARTRQILYTGGKKGVNRKNLFRITASAVEYDRPPLDYGSYIWWDTPETIIDPTRIKVLGWWLFGSHLDSEGELYRVLPDNAALDLNLRIPGVKHYNATPGQSKYKLVHETVHPALTDTDLDRLNLGVGEYVNFSGWPAETVWTTTAGSLSDITNATTTLTAPSNAVTKVTVKATVRGQSLQTDFAVLEPSGIATNTYVASLYSFPTNPPSSGAGMSLIVYMKPTFVSFYRVWMEEVGENASNVQGYFANAYPAPSHIGNGADDPFKLNYDNSWDHNWDNAYSPGAIEIADGSDPFPDLPWSNGQFTWNIPWIWWVDSNIVHSNATGWQQVFTIDVNGTVTLSKFNHTVTRTINQSTGTSN